jgi:RNA polymerase sigma factor (sigma-70 family)
VDARDVTSTPTDPVDGGAVDRLFRARRDASVRLAVLLVGDMATAEEIVQDAFLEVARRWARLDNPAGYLRTAVVNRCRDHHRHLAVIRRRPIPPPPMHVAEPEHDELWAVLARLPARRRAAVVLRYYEDLPVNEIARLLDCRPSTVSSLLHRGLADLRKVLADES